VFTGPWWRSRDLGYSFDVEVSGCDENEGQREIMNGGAHNYDITLLGKVVIMWKATDTQVSRQNPLSPSETDT
jgi:hypothetical protein